MGRFRRRSRRDCFLGVAFSVVGESNDEFIFYETGETKVKLTISRCCHSRPMRAGSGDDDGQERRTAQEGRR